MVCLLWDAITVEHVKAAAALIQAFGFIGAAVLAYKLAQKLERHKYKIRINEIKFAKFHEKRLETLEAISAIQGKILYETSELVFYGGVKEVLERGEGETREAYLERSFAPRHKDITAALLELDHAQWSGIVYLPDPIYERLTKFRVAITALVRTYTSKMLEPRHDSEFYGKLSEDAIARFNELKAERDEIVKLVRSHLERDEVG